MAPDPSPAGSRTLIESLGVYLPPREVTTDEVLRGCARKIRFPLERLTGIKSRRMAGDTEFALDLAKQAVARCLAGSRYGPADVDIVISASISHCDTRAFSITAEPSTAVRLKAHFGLDHAIAFDIASACSGMFTAMHILDALLQAGAIRCGLVVSGEYISHLAMTAQKEIDGLLDSRLACLTLGDSAAAVMLHSSPVPGVGFHALDLRTFGGYAKHCTAGPTEQPHGGAIMFTDSLVLTDAATRHGASHAQETLARAGWAADAFDHLIMHQTSRTGLSSAAKEINRRLRARVCHPGNTIDNLEQRGNTATTTHLLAVADHVASGRIRSGDSVIFAISSSGLTVGTGLYTFDDLPDRLAGRAPKPTAPPAAEGRTSRPSGAVSADRIRIGSIGTVPPAVGTRRDSFELLKLAATDCLDRAGRHRREVGLLLYAGVYRTGFLCEPAIAALLAGELDMNARDEQDDCRTLAFDVTNGALGVLNACYVASQMVRAGKVATALVVAAEIENNAGAFPEDLLGIEETGSALLLEADPGGATGFGPFLFHAFPEYIGAFTSACVNRDGKACLAFDKDPDLQRYYIEAITATVAKLLEQEELDLASIHTILPPQISSPFITELSRTMHLPREKFVDAVDGRRDLYTSSLPLALQHAHDHGRARPGEIGLIISVGSGIQVGCALYYF